MKNTNEQNLGLFYAVCAFVLWGFFPLFFNLFDKNISAYEILAHRIVWSVIFMFFALMFLGKLKNALNLLTKPQTQRVLFLSGILISINWGVYVYAVNNGKILEASLGYFINPLMNMLLGALVFKERLNFTARIAIGIVFLAICLQIYALGELPLIAIILPSSFALYGVVRKRAKVPALEGLFAETLLVFPLALSYIFYLIFNAQSHFLPSQNALLMALSGAVTIVPLLAFNAAAMRVNLTTIGYLQYLSPSIGMLLGVFVFSEQLGILKASSFGLIWLALALVMTGQIKFKKDKNG